VIKISMPQRRPDEEDDDDEDDAAIFSHKLLGFMTAGEIFGEISFLEGVKTTGAQASMLVLGLSHLTVLVQLRLFRTMKKQKFTF
jgi:hypothetical protein